VQVLSLDEAYLDVAGAVRLLGSPAHIAEQVRGRVWETQQIRCSVGVAATPTVAKMATNRAKPDGVCVVPPQEAVAFLRGHRVEDVYGVGPRTAAVLHRLELHTVADIAAVPVEVVEAALGRHAGRWLWALAHGRDHRGMEPGRSQQRAERSMSNESTFGADVSDPEELSRQLLRLAMKLAGRLRAAGMAARTIGLRVRYSDFETLDRSRSVGEPTDVSHEIFATTRELLRALSAPGQPGQGRRPVRLLGVKVTGLVPRSRWQPQLELGARTEGWADLDRAVDQASARFGRSVVRPATLVPGNTTRGESRHGS
jgi:DNA polymerase-4